MKLSTVLFLFAALLVTTIECSDIDIDNTDISNTDDTNDIPPSTDTNTDIDISTYDDGGSGRQIQSSISSTFDSGKSSQSGSRSTTNQGQTTPTQQDQDHTISTNDLLCTDVSVEGDATYCIKGPICSGSGAKPAGTNCPCHGDIARKDCHPYLPSYHPKTRECIAPTNAKCLKIKTGAWGCVWHTPMHGSKSDIDQDPTTSDEVVLVESANTESSTNNKTAISSAAPGVIVGVIAAIVGVLVCAVVVFRRRRRATLDSPTLQAIVTPIEARAVGTKSVLV